MGYKLLGMAVWKGAKLYVRHKYGPPHSSKKPVIVGGLAVALIAALVLAKSRDDSE